MITSKQKWLPFWRFLFCHLCSQRGLKFLVWFHSVQSECVAVRGEDHVVFWCSNGIGWHCWAFDQFHREWPVRKSYCLTEVKCLWVNFFFFFFHYAFLPICTLCLVFTSNNVLSTPGLFCLPKCVHFSKSMFREDDCSVHELCAFHSTVDSLFILIRCEWEWFKPEWCLFYKDLQRLNS